LFDYPHSKADLWHPRKWATKRHLCHGIRGFGSSLCKYSIDTTGTIYLVRADGQPFPKQHAEAICGYIKNKVEPQLAAAIANKTTGQLISERETVLRGIRPAEFQSCFDELKAAKILAGDEEWREFPSPYEIKQQALRTRIDEVWEAQRARGFEQSSEKHSRQARGHFTMEESMHALG
jgi:hypothetical protein